MSWRRGEPTSQLKLAVVGIGGAGCNMITNIKRTGFSDAKLIAVNTDAASLSATKADHKVLAGESFLGGRSARTIENGKKAMEAVKENLVSMLSDRELIVLLAGLGGGAGTGGIVTLAETIKESLPNALTISYVVIPFASEGEVRINNAKYGLSEIIDLSDVTWVAFNDVLKRKFTNVPLTRAYKMMDDRLFNVVRGLASLQNLSPLPGMQNVDFAIMKELAKGSGLGYAGFGEGRTAREAFESSLVDPFGDADHKGAKGVVGILESTETAVSVEGMTYVQDVLTTNLGIPEVYFGLKPSIEMTTPKVTVYTFGVKSRMVEDFLSSMGGG